VTITSDQIVLSESEVMADTDDGGGRMSGRIVASGEINNTFPDISRIDRVYGRVNLRKLFLAINAANQDTLLGAHTILSQRAKDPNVHVLLFDTGSHTDRRAEAQDRIESYVVPSSEASFWLWGKQLEGQRAIQALSYTTNRQDPEPGQIFVLDDGQNSQFVRVTGVDMKEQTFTIDRGSSGFYNFRLKTYVIELAQPLTHEFVGGVPHPTGNTRDEMKILKTQIADAAKYMGASPLAAPAVVGDRTITVENVYSPLVPSAQSENAITDQQAGAQAAIIRPASNSTISVTASNVTTDANGAGLYFAGRAITPGTLQITGQNGDYTDDGGKLKHVGGSNYLDVENSVVDYFNGEIRAFYNSGGSASRSVTIGFTPGAPVLQQSKQGKLEVNQQTRSLTWVFQADPKPAPTTLTVEFMVQGSWYLLRDTGNGELSGDGTGTVDYATGTINFTLAALPDAGTHIIVAWGEKQGVVIEAGATITDTPAVRLEIGDTINDNAWTFQPHSA